MVSAIKSLINKISTKWFECLMALLLFILAMPYFIWSNTLIYTFATILFFILLCLKIKYIEQKKLLFNLLLFFEYFILIFKIISNNNGSIGGILFQSILFIPFLFLDKDIWYQIFQVFVKCYAVLIAFPVIEYVLVFLCEIPIGYDLIEPSPFNSHVCLYEKYNFMVVMHSWSLMPRFFAYFDEPGVVGTISMVIMYTNKYNLKNISNLIIFISGLLSFSFFFYLATFFYILFFSKFKIKIFVLIIALFLIYLLRDNLFVQDAIFERFFKFFSGGEDSGLSVRVTDYFNSFYENLSVFDLLFGVRNSLVPFSTTYKYLFAVCGIINVSFFSLLYFIKAYNQLGESKELLIYILIFVFVIAQRPFINVLIYVFLITVPMYVLSSLKNGS